MNQSAPSARACSRSYNIETPDRLLDAAERLFARQNYQMVKLKEIAAEANANVGQIVYHFGRKELLVRAAIRRRADELNRERIALLSQYEELVGKDNVEVEPLVRACILPYFNRLEGDDEQWRCFATFVGRSVWDGNLSSYMSESFDDVAKLYIEAFRRALPRLRQSDAIRGFHFLMAIMHAASVRDPRIEALLGAPGGSVACTGYKDSIVPYITGGFKAMAAARGGD